MTAKKWSLAALALVLLVAYNGLQPSLVMMRTMEVPGRETLTPEQQRLLDKERYGPSLAWLDRLRRAQTDDNIVKLDFRVLSSVMIAGLASGFKSQVANMVWMKSDEYWHKGLSTRQVPLMEVVVTLDPQFIEAWSTAGWHWAYNIYADVELNQALKSRPQEVRRQQEAAIETGLDYLRRGSELNPETYRLWFEHAWTRANKAGYYDEETIEIFRTARAQKDAREMEQTLADGTTIKVDGLDSIGRTIGHIYEKRPDIDKALQHYGGDLLDATPGEMEWLRVAGEYWRRYGTDYPVIYDLYQDPAYRSQVLQIVPDAARLAQAHEVRMQMAAKTDGTQPTGAYVTIAARYLPSWELMKEGDALNQQGQKAAAQQKYQQAINTIIGVMNADPRYHLQGLPALAEVMELRGDAPAAVQTKLAQAREAEESSSQEIGLHLLATLYEHQAAATEDAARQKELYQKAYETWYRARVRNNLNFYAKRKTLEYEDNPRFAFKAPEDLIKQIQESRREGDLNAAPPPNVPQYQTHEH